VLVDRSRDGFEGVIARARRRAFSRVYADLGAGAEDAAFIAGCGRSGTTWLAELLTLAGGSRYMFEPFHPVRSPLRRDFPARLYLGAGDDEPEREAAARRVLAGGVRDMWIDQYNDRALPRKRVIKDVWSNLRLGWLKALAPRMPSVLVLRHPYPTVASQLRTGWDWHVEPDVFVDQPRLMERHLAQFERSIRLAEPGLERHVVAWCIDALVPLRELRPGDARVVFYEHLVSHPDRELGSLFAFVGDALEPRVVEAAGRPSAMSRRGSAVVTGGDAVSSWTHRVSDRDLAITLRILADFGLDALYGEGPMPLLDAGEDALTLPWR
jgi:hypothetical protein